MENKKRKKEKFYVRYATKQTTLPQEFPVPKGAIYGRKGKQFWVCDCFKVDKDGSLPVYFYNGNDWIATAASTQSKVYSMIVYAIRKLGFIPTVEYKLKPIYNVKCQDLMRTYSVHKKGTGSRINTNQINADLKWREVTELGHWANIPASVIANSIR